MNFCRKSMFWAGMTFGDSPINHMNVFLTGATGFIGQQVAKELVKRGHSLTCLVRDTNRAHDIKELPARLAIGDIRDYQTLTNIMPGHDAVIHTAAIYQFGYADRQKMHDVNVNGTENVMLAAIKTKMNKIVYCGSTIVLDPASQSENKLNLSPDSQYEKTKSMAHNKVANFIKQGAPAVIVMPNHVYGPDDPHGLGGIIKKYLKGEAHVGLNAPYCASMVHVQDVARGIVAALEKGRIGQSYILAGEPVSWEEFMFLLETHSGISRPSVNISIKTASWLAHLLDFISKITGRTPRISTESVNQLTKKLIFNSDKAKIELGFVPRPFSRGLQETIAHYQKELFRA